jgi:cyclophilin family peptidyl-prolyl cis-trans isomerase
VGINSRPEVNRVWADRTIFDDRVIQSNKRGTVTFASTGDPNSRSTQFFINKLDENVRLDPLKFAPFGEVVAGMEFVDQLYSGYGDPPIQGQLVSGGDAIIKSNFPRMDRIIKASILTVVEP